MTRTRTVEGCFQSLECVLSEIVVVRGDVVHPQAFEVAHGRVQTHGLGNRWGTGFEAGNALGRRETVYSYVGDHAAAAEEGWHRIKNVLTRPQHPNTGGTEHLVSREGEEVNVEVGHVGGIVGNRLRRVNRDKRADGVCRLSEFFDGGSWSRAR